jgi:hypothetical protein
VQVLAARAFAFGAVAADAGALLAVRVQMLGMMQMQASALMEIPNQATHHEAS